MEKRTTTTQAQAVSALGIRINPMDEAGLVDSLKQMFRQQATLAQSQVNDSRASNSRIHWGAAAVIADLLCRYYQAHEDMEVASIWAQRAVRYHALAFQRVNRIAHNIGATET